MKWVSHAIDFIEGLVRKLKPPRKPKPAPVPVPAPLPPSIPAPIPTPEPQAVPTPEELSLGNLSITVTSHGDDPAEAKFDLPDGSSVTREIPIVGGLQMKLGLGLGLTYVRGAAGGGSYRAPAVHFDNADWLSRASAPAGVTTINTCICSVWVKLDPATTSALVNSQSNGFFNWTLQEVASGETSRLVFTDPDFNEDQIRLVTGRVDNVWTHILFAYDRSDANKCHALSGGVVNEFVNLQNTQAANLTTETSFLIGTSNVGNPNAGIVADVSQCYIAFNQWLDLSNPANVAKFIAGGKPVDLGADGSTPTGTAPTIFFEGDATGFATNKGTGGTFSLTGSLTNASTSPSD